MQLQERFAQILAGATAIQRRQHAAPAKAVGVLNALLKRMFSGDLPPAVTAEEAVVV